MSVRLPLGRGLFFLCAFLFSLLALLPLRLASDWLNLGANGVAARDAVGSVWGGVLHQAQYRDTQLGDLLAELKALPLVGGRARIQLGRNDGAPFLSDGATATAQADRFEGAITVTRNSYTVGNVTARLPVAQQFAPLPITAIDLSDVSARFVSGQCAAAEGAVTVTTSGSIGGLPIPATLTGTARCDGGALLLALAGASGLDQLALRFTGSDTYRATLSVRPTDPLLQQRLAASGFAAANGVYSLNVDGRLQ